MYRVAVAAVDDADDAGCRRALREIIQQAGPVISAIDHEERLQAPVDTSQPGSSSQTRPLHPTRLRPTSRHARRDQTIYGPTPREDLPPPADSDFPTTSTAPAVPSCEPPTSEGLGTSETHIPPSDPSVELQTPVPATHAEASISADMDDFWSGILHIEPFSASPASGSPSAQPTLYTQTSGTSPQAPAKHYTRRRRARQIDISSSSHIPMVLEESSTLGSVEHEAPTAHVDDPAREPHVDDPPSAALVDAAPAGEPHVDDSPPTSPHISDDVRLHHDRPRRAIKRPRCGTE